MALIDSYEAALFDLDGVVYLGPEPVPGAAEGIDRLRERGVKVGFVTNNAARTPQAVADHLVELGVRAETSDVVTSSQAGARLLAEQLPAGAKVFIVGTEALADEVRNVGLEPVREWQPTPAAVIQGYDPALSFSVLNDAGWAIQRGALWVATNTDSNRPTDKGLVPGNGAAVDALRTAVAVDPLVAGKPFPPLMQETLRRLEIEDAIFVGDRLDTDVSGGVACGIDTLLVFTGAHGKTELVHAVPAERPTHIGHDLRALLADARTVSVEGEQTRCNDAVASVEDDRAVLTGGGDDADAQLDGLWALAHLAWARADAGEPLDCDDAQKALDKLR